LRADLDENPLTKGVMSRRLALPARGCSRRCRRQPMNRLQHRLTR
jgi:hypothetical protein